MCLTPSLPWCHLKTTNKNAKFKTLQPLNFVFFFALACERIFIKTHTIESRCDMEPETPPTPVAGISVHFQPGNVTDCGSEGVKRYVRSA